MGSLGQHSRRGAREGKAESEQTGGMWRCHCTLQSAFRSTCAHIVPPHCLGVQEIMEDRTVSMDNSMSVTEIHARNRILQRCGVEQSEYHVVFTPGAKEALMLVGEAYPFCKHNVYMTALDEEWEVESQFGGISQFATFKVCPPAPPSPITSGVEIVSCEICVQESKVIPAPLAWLDLRIAGSQLSTNFRRKSKSNPKVTPPPPYHSTPSSSTHPLTRPRLPLQGLFAYPVQAGGLKNSLHWVSEAQRNLWHVLLDASEVVLDEEMFDLGQHKPDYLVCVSPKIVGYPTSVTCLLIRRSSQLIGKKMADLGGGQQLILCGVCLAEKTL